MENELKKKETFSDLLLLYGKLLTKSIYHSMQIFYLEDYSITEISQLENVSRNAVFESLSHGEKQLEKYEDALHLKEKYDRLLSALDRLEGSQDEKEKKQLLEQIKGELEYGI